MRNVCLFVAVGLISAQAVLLAQATGDHPEAGVAGSVAAGVSGDADRVDLASTQRVTLHLKSALPAAMISALAAQAHSQMQLMVLSAGPHLGPVPVSAHDFDVNQEPLIATILRIEGLYGLTHSKMYGEDSVMFVKRAERANPFAAARPSTAQQPISPMCFSGPFAVVADDIVRQQWMDPVPADNTANAGDAVNGDAGNGDEIGAPITQSALELHMRVLAEPRVTVLWMPSLPTVQTMTDDQDEPLWDAPPDNMLHGSWQGDYEQNAMVLRPRIPSASATRIASFNGFVPLHVVTRSHRYELTHLDRPGTRTEVIGGLRVTLDALQDDAGTPTQQAIINVDPNGMDPQEWEDRQLLLAHGSHIQIFDRFGNLLSEPFRWYPFNGIQFQIGLPTSGPGRHMGPVGRAFRLAWDFPLEAGDVQVPFSFTNLPLPAQ